MLGRRIDCDVVINEPGFSREQTTFFFDDSTQKWFVKDGGEKSSSTGTWYKIFLFRHFVDKPYHIKNNFKFKVGPSLMKIEIKNYL